MQRRSILCFILVCALALGCAVSAFAAEKPVISGSFSFRGRDDSEGAVSISSDQAVRLFYAVTEPGEAMPAIDTEGEGIVCEAGETELALSGLSLGEKRVWVIARNSDGLLSDPIPVTLFAAPALTLKLRAEDLASFAPGGSIAVKLTARAKALCELTSFKGSFAMPAGFTLSSVSAGSFTPGEGIADILLEPAEPILLGNEETELLTLTLTAKSDAVPQSGAFALRDGAEAKTVGGAALDYDARGLMVSIAAPGADAAPKWSAEKPGTALWTAESGRSYSLELYRDGVSVLYRVPAGLQRGVTGGSFDFYSVIASCESGSYAFRVRDEGTGTWSELSPAVQYWSVLLPEKSEGVSVIPMPGALSPLPEGGDFSFALKLAEGYYAEKDFAVSADEELLTPDAEGVYTVKNIHADRSIGILGIGTGHTIGDVPLIESAALPDAVMGDAYSFRLTTKNNERAEWSAQGKLPAGLYLSADGVLSGVPERDGSFPITFFAKNRIGTAEKRLTLRITGERYALESAEWVRGNSGVLELSGEGEGLRSVVLDGAVLEAGEGTWTVKDDRAALSSEHLNTLTVGEHNIDLYYLRGRASGVLRVVQENAAVAPTLMSAPADVTVAAGERALFSCTADGTLPLLCQWEVDRGDGKGFVRLRGATARSYAPENTDESMDGWLFRCVVTNEAGEAVSEAAVLRVTANDRARSEADAKLPLSSVLLGAGGVCVLAALVLLLRKRKGGKTKSDK